MAKTCQHLLMFWDSMTTETCQSFISKGTERQQSMSQEMTRTSKMEQKEKKKTMKTRCKNQKKSDDINQRIVVYQHFLYVCAIINNIYLFNQYLNPMLLFILIFAFYLPSSIYSQEFYALKNWTSHQIPQPVQSVAFFNNNKYIIAQQTQSIQIWSADNFQKLDDINFKQTISAILVTKQYIFVGTENGKIRMINRQMQQVFSFWYEIENGYASDLQMMGNSKLLVVGSSSSGQNPYIYKYVVSRDKIQLEDSIKTFFSPGTNIKKIVFDQLQNLAVFAPSALAISQKTQFQHQIPLSQQNSQVSLVFSDPNIYNQYVQGDSPPPSQPIFIYQIANYSILAALSLSTNIIQTHSIQFISYIPNYLFVFVDGGFYVQQIYGFSSSYAAISLDYSTQCLQEDNSIYFGTSQGSIYQYQVNQQESKWTNIWNLGRKKILDIQISDDEEHMIVGTDSGMHLMTKNPQKYINSWITGALLLLTLISILIVLICSHFKSKSLIESVNRKKKEINQNLPTPSISLFSSEDQISLKKGSTQQ